MQAPIKSETDVLIVGAGPTGLTTAIELQRRGIDCRIIEKDASSIETSRALAIQPRTRQIFEDMGVLDEILTKGIRVKGAIVYRKKTELLRLNMDYLDPPSPYPFLWWLPQNQTEQILVERLEELGGRVEFEHKLVAFGQDDESVTATTMRTNEESHQTESITATWLIGCDGAHSRVRKTLGLPLQGVTQPQELLVADVDIDWERPVDEGSIWFHEAGVLAALPMITESRWRLFADVTPTPPEERPEATRDVLEQIVRERTGDADVTIADAPWTSTVITNQRMVERYRSGRIFLAGDASHVHSPLGGQGMNLGIQDAYNLAWKLALVTDETSPDELLETYAQERMPAAEEVISQTGISGTLLVTANPVVKRFRYFVLTRLLEPKQIQALILRAMPQLDVEYRGRALSKIHSESPLSGLLNAQSKTALVRRARQAWNAPKAGERPPDGPCRNPDGTETSLYREIHGETEFVLLLFTGTEPAESDELRQIAQTVRERAGDLVTPYFIVPDAQRATENYEGILLRDDGKQLHKRYNATVPSLYLLRPDDYVGFRSQPARTDPLLTYLNVQLQQTAVTEPRSE